MATAVGWFPAMATICVVGVSTPVVKRPHCKIRSEDCHRRR